jgi:hypothetical protein
VFCVSWLLRRLFLCASLVIHITKKIGSGAVRSISINQQPIGIRLSFVTFSAAVAFVQTFPSYSSLGIVSWQTTFIEAMKYETRWRTGKYDVKKLQGHKGGVSCLSISCGLMVSGSGTLP